MKGKIVISVVVTFVIAGLFAPPDLVAQWMNGALGAALCGVLLLILSRLRSVKSASPAVHTLVCAVACLIAILSVAYYVMSAGPGSTQP
jgi:hypothetical protein